MKRSRKPQQARADAAFEARWLQRNFAPRFRQQRVGVHPGRYSDWTVARDQLLGLALKQHYIREYAREKEKLVVIHQVGTDFEPTYDSETQTNIVYCISDTFGATDKPNALTMMEEATAGWQGVANLRFTYASGEDSSCDQDNADVDFAVMPAANPEFAACAANKMMWSGALSSWGCRVTSSPSSPYLRGVLLVNTSVLLFPGQTWTGVFRHELGHILGFRHEHAWRPGQACEFQTFGDLSGRQLTAYDVDSVMHYPTVGCGGVTGSDYQLSSLDGEGARQIYGMPASWYVPVLFTH